VVNAHDVLDQLAVLGVTIGVSGNGKFTTTTKTPGTIDRDLAAGIRAHRELLAHVALGRRTGHALAPCSSCTEASMVAVSTSDGKARKTWPTCRMTPGCDGRHEPRPADLTTIDYVEQPAQSQPPKKNSKKRFLGEWPAWPDPEVA
jgi:hypothetical protein